MSSIPAAAQPDSSQPSPPIAAPTPDVGVEAGAITDPAQLLAALLELVRAGQDLEGFKALCNANARAILDNFAQWQKSGPRRDHCRTGRVWTYVGDLLHPYIVYDYTPTRSRDGPLVWLGNWKGYLQADAYAGYDAVYAGGVIEVACWAHCRRYFFDASQSDSIRSAQMLGLIQQLYAVEKQAAAMTVPERKDLRQARARPVLERIKLWLDCCSSAAVVLPRSPMGQAITYALNQWDALCIYTSDGRLSIDNNIAERDERRVAIGRKNWLWAGTDEAAMGHAVLWSLIASAQRQEVDPQFYLRSVLAWLPATPASQVERFVPGIWKRDWMAEHAAQLQAHHQRIFSAAKPILVP